jgi:hypothetical protein
MPMHPRRRIAILAAAAVWSATAAGGAPASAAARGTTWTAPVVLDGAGGPNGRLTAPIGEDTAAVIYGGVVHLFYSAGIGEQSVLRQATFGGPATFETLDGEGGTAGRTTHSVGRDVSAAVYGDALHVFYRDDTNGDLRHAWLGGSTWRFRTLDGAATRHGRIEANVGDASVASVYGGRLEVVYLEETGLDVRRASYDGASWSFSDLDGDSSAGGHTEHEVGFNLEVATWGGSMHVLYYERDPAYGPDLGWVREAVLDGTSWTYSRAFRVSAIWPGKTLALGVVAADDVYVAYNNVIQSDVRLRWRRWDGAAWSDSSLLSRVFDGHVSARGVFAVADNIPSLAYFDLELGSESATYFTWSGGTVSTQGSPHGGAPSSALVVRGVPRVYWGAGGIAGDCCDLLLRTSRP